MLVAEAKPKRGGAKKEIDSDVEELEDVLRGAGLHAAADAEKAAKAAARDVKAKAREAKAEARAEARESNPDRVSF